MFNFKRFKRAAAEVTQEKQLDKDRDSNDGLDVTQKQLKKVREGKDRTEVLEGQLDEVRTATDSATIEAQLDEQKVDDTPVRTGKDKHQAPPVNLLAEIADQKKAKAINKAAEDTDTAFWDKYVGSQLEGEQTKVPGKMGPSQLENSGDRFKNIKPDDVVNNRNIKEMVMASMQDADAMLYFIFRSAAEHGRDLTQEESVIIDQINRDKLSMLRVLTAHPESNQ